MNDIIDKKVKLYCNDCKTELTIRGEVFTHYNHDVVEINQGTISRRMKEI